MIHVIGTCHKTQIWNDLVRKRALGAPPRSKLQEFQEYLTATAAGLGVTAIGEEMTADRVTASGDNAVSVARVVTTAMQIQHVFCEPDGEDREKLGLRAGDEMVRHVKGLAAVEGRDWTEIHREEVRKQFPIREKFWAEKLAVLCPNDRQTLFICGADHCQTVVQTFQHQELNVTVNCSDWTVLSKILCPCCI